MDGIGIRSNPTITQESREHAKKLTHVHQAKLRNEKRELTSKTRTRPNWSSIESVRMRVMHWWRNTDISESTFEHFFKRKKGRLKGIIAARKDRAVPPSPLNKGTIQHASDGADCLILRAFKCRSLPPLVTIMRQEPRSYENTTTGEIEQVQAADSAIMHMWLTYLWVKGTILEPIFWLCLAFIGLIKECFDVSWHMKQMLGESELQSSNALNRLLCSRRRDHVKNKIKDPQNHPHRSLKWVVSNFGRITAIMQLNRHSKSDLECFEADSALKLIQRV